MSVRLLHRYYEKLRFLYCLLAQVLLIVPGNTLVCAVFFPRVMLHFSRAWTHLLTACPHAVDWSKEQYNTDVPSSQGFLIRMPGSSTPVGEHFRSI